MKQPVRSRGAVDHTARAKSLRDRAEECRTLARIMPSETAAAYFTLSGLRPGLLNSKSTISKAEADAPSACDVGHCARPIRRAASHQLTFIEPTGPRAMTMIKLLMLGCVLAVVAITLKVRLDTPQGPQPLARAIVTTHLQQLPGELALP